MRHRRMPVACRCPAFAALSAAIALVVIAAHPAPARASSAAIATGSMISNPSFETSTSGWNSWQGALSYVADSTATDGSYVAKVTATTGTSYALTDTPSLSKSVPSGWYSAAAWVKACSTSATGKTVTIVIRERNPSGVIVGQTTSNALKLTAAYRQLGVVAKLSQPGDSLEVEVLQSSSVAGDAFCADAISLAPITMYGFEDGTTDGWKSATGGGPVTNSTARAYSGTHSLQLNVPGTGNAAFETSTAPTGVIPGTRITYLVYEPQGDPLMVAPYIADGAWNYHYAQAVPLWPGGWRTITWTVPPLTGAPRYLGLQVLDGQHWAGNLGLDAVVSGVAWPPASTPANNPNPTPPPTAAPNPQGVGGSWTLKFDDEFSGSSLDQTKWSTCFPWGCAGNWPSEVQCYVPGNVLVGGDVVRLEATAKASSCAGKTQPDSSGLISSYGSYHFQYGFVEERFMLPRGKGFWPTFWLLAMNRQWPPEVDGYESAGSSPTAISQHYHYTTSTNAPGCAYSGPDFSAGFHTVGIDVEPLAITWYVDGQAWCQFSNPAGLSTIVSPWYIISNLAIGSPTGGTPDSSTPFPSYLSIDYIRAWQK